MRLRPRPSTGTKMLRASRHVCKCSRFVSSRGCLGPMEWQQHLHTWALTPHHWLSSFHKRLGAGLIAIPAYGICSRLCRNRNGCHRYQGAEYSQRKTCKVPCTPWLACKFGSKPPRRAVIKALAGRNLYLRVGLCLRGRGRAHGRRSTLYIGENRHGARFILAAQVLHVVYENYPVSVVSGRWCY